MKLKKITTDSLTIAHICVLSISGTILILVAIFLYIDFYKTIIYTEDVVALKQGVFSEDINIERFNSVFKKNEYKISRLLGRNIYDPFKSSNEVIPTQAQEEEQVQSQAQEEASAQE